MSLSNFSYCNLIGLASSLAILIAEDLNTEEIGILSAFFSALGDNLAIITATPLNSSQSQNNTQNSNSNNSISNSEN